VSEYVVDEICLVYVASADSSETWGRRRRAVETSAAKGCMRDVKDKYTLCGEGVSQLLTNPQ